MFDGTNLTLNSNVDQVVLRVVECGFFSIFVTFCKQTVQTLIRRRVLDMHCLPMSHKKDD